jgi:hypothetical protein
MGGRGVQQQVYLAEIRGFPHQLTSRETLSPIKSTKNGYSKSPLTILLVDIRYPGLNPGPSDY